HRRWPHRRGLHRTPLRQGPGGPARVGARGARTGLRRGDHRALDRLRSDSRPADRSGRDRLGAARERLRWARPLLCAFRFLLCAPSRLGARTCGKIEGVSIVLEILTADGLPPLAEKPGVSDRKSVVYDHMILCLLVVCILNLYLLMATQHDILL